MIEVAGASVALEEVGKLVAELAKLGYKTWRSKQEAKKKLASILNHVQDELKRNYKSLQDAHNGSPYERLDTRIFERTNEALNQALEDSPSVLDPLRQAYQTITPGLQQRLAKGPLTDGGGAELNLL